ncbi:unnamed protein product [Polarella glacialis]|uniref:Methyltransferase domain-containing protein n=1 Tax=Polarella glacialis TaxID=89957 RepID=A0A813F3L0_POLGL|nr:unnamed protein product [Polarella glacialis]
MISGNQLKLLSVLGVLSCASLYVLDGVLRQGDGQGVAQTLTNNKVRNAQSPSHAIMRDWKCPSSLFYGGYTGGKGGKLPEGDGGRWVCDPVGIAKAAEDVSGPGCLIYSIGSDGEFSFEKAIHDQISNKCEIHTFDRNPNEFYLRPEYNPGYPHERVPSFVNYHIGELSRSKNLAQLVKDLGHNGRTIEILKIDCEGCEHDTYKEWLDADVDVRQILGEFHGYTEQFSRFFIEKGYAVFHSGGGINPEMSYVKLPMRETAMVSPMMLALDARRPQQLPSSQPVAKTIEEIEILRRLRWKCPSSLFYGGYTGGKGGKLPEGDGGRWVCDPVGIAKAAEDVSGPGCLIYSIGSDGEFSFEKAIHDQISNKCEIHTFDRNPNEFYLRPEYNPGYPHERVPSFVNYHIGELSRSKNLAQLVKDLGHNGRTIEILKIDCEGCEHDTYKEWLDADVDVRQILGEFHGYTEQFSRFFIEKGYAVFHSGAGSDPEMSYVKLPMRESAMVSPMMLALDATGSQIMGVCDVNCFSVVSQFF